MSPAECGSITYISSSSSGSSSSMAVLEAVAVALEARLRPTPLTRAPPRASPALSRLARSSLLIPPSAAPPSSCRVQSHWPVSRFSAWTCPSTVTASTSDERTRSATSGSPYRPSSRTGLVDASANGELNRYEDIDSGTERGRTAAGSSSAAARGARERERKRKRRSDVHRRRSRGRGMDGARARDHPPAGSFVSCDGQR